MKIIRVGKMPDRQLVKLIAAFKDEWGDNASSQISLADIAIPTSGDAYAEFSKTLKSTEGIDTADLHADPSRVAVRFRRGIGGLNGQIDQNRQPSPYFDEFAIEATIDNRGHRTATPEDLMAVLGLIQKYAVNAPSPSGENNSATDLLNTQFAQLNSLLSEVTERVHVRQLELDQQFYQRVSELEERFAQQRADVEAGQANNEDELANRRAALDAREAAIDNSQHMHARRELREKITVEIQQRLGKTLVHRQSSWVRWGVLAIMLSAAAGLGFMSFSSVTEYAQTARLAATTTIVSPSSQYAEEVRYAQSAVSTGTIWYLLARATISGFGAVAFVLYAIGWLKRIYAEDVRAQRDLERYSIDLSRASWAIETIMEAKTAGDVSIPDILVAGVSRNLFEVAAKPDADSNDALASFLKASIRGKIGPNGAEFDFNNRGTSKLAKEVEAG